MMIVLLLLCHVKDSIHWNLDTKQLNPLSIYVIVIVEKLQ